MLNPVKVLARALMASVFISGGINQLRAPDALGPVVERAKATYGLDVPVSGRDLVAANGAGMVAGGAALALGVLPRTSALALAGLLIPTNVVGHAFWDAKDERSRMQHTSAFLANAAIVGGLLMVALDRKD